MASNRVAQLVERLNTESDFYLMPLRFLTLGRLQSVILSSTLNGTRRKPTLALVGNRKRIFIQCI